MEIETFVYIKGVEIPCVVDAEVSEPYHYSGEYRNSGEMRDVAFNVYAGKQKRNITKFLDKKQIWRLQDVVLGAI